VDDGPRAVSHIEKKECRELKALLRERESDRDARMRGSICFFLEK